MSDKKTRGRPRSSEIQEYAASENLTPRQAADELDVEGCSIFVHPDAPRWPRTVRLEIGRTLRALLDGPQLIGFVQATTLYTDPVTSEDVKQETLALTRRALPPPVAKVVQFAVAHLGKWPAREIAAEIRRIRHTLTRREPRFGEDRLRENAARALAALALKRAYAIDSTRQIEFARALLEEALDWLPDA